MSGLEKVSTDETHRRYMRLIFKHGTEAEVDDVRSALEQMRALWDQFPGSKWDPMEEVRLPGFLRERCHRVARQRQAKAKQFAFREKYGAQRSFESELRSVEAQYAAALMLGIPFAGATSEQEARAHGNLGFGLSAFIPKPGSWSLIVGEKEPPKRIFFLIVGDEGLYECHGFIRAGEAQRPEYQRTFNREGVISRPYLVPRDSLSPLREWFK